MKLKDILTPEEMRQVTGKNNFAGAFKFVFDWGVMALTFIVAANYPNPLTILLALIVIGSRQLGLGILVHECGHRTLFTSNFWNDFCGRWLAGYPVFSNMDAYMRGHWKHHREAGTEGDPDLPNYKDYPVPRSSFKRKVKRDLTGQVGWRRIKSIYAAIGHLSALDPGTRQYLSRSLAVNVGLLAIFSAFGHPWLYLLWIGAFMTSHMLVTRIRQIAEHAAVPNQYSLDPRENTRTLLINPVERFFIAPHQVNFHLEHHLMPSVPIYRLKRLHEILKSKRYYEGVEFQRGYLNLLRTVTYPDTAQATTR
ncbi:MAG: fatty acid desaturase family protein [Pseudomonadales bacterium]